MVLDYYQLREQPFGVTPDSRFLYASANHREALASLLYGVESGRGFVALIAPPGLGKTTLLFDALERLRQKARTVFLFQTVCTPVDFLRALLTDLGVAERDGSLVELQSKLNEIVEEQSRLGKPLVVVIDEAQNLEGPVLELVRMLSNFETGREKLIEIILSGQPQLAEKLLSPELVQLRQRVSIIAGLKAFSPEETALYIDHRLRLAGYLSDEPLFSKAAVDLIARASEGIPRNINNLCFNALSLGCALKRKPIDLEIIREVIADLDLAPLLKANPPAAGPEKPEKKEASTGAASISSSGEPAGPWRFQRDWLASKGMAAGAAALILAAALFAGILFKLDTPARHRTASVAESIAQNKLTPPPATPIADLRAAPATLQAEPRAVQVAAGETLYEICMKNLGSYNARVLEEIHQLNPSIKDADHILSGQKLRLPSPLSSETPVIAEQSSQTAVGERDMQ